MRAVAVVLVGLQAVGQEALEEAAKDITLMSLVLAPLSTELQILVVEVVEEAVITVEQLKVQAVQAAQVSSSSNTSPNLITKSSNHQAHGLHLLALLRSST
jgi:hypothetical protein